MPRSGRTFIWFHCLFCNHMWKFHIDEDVVNPTVELTGEIFVATKSGIKRRLGSVKVGAIPEDVLIKHLESKALHGARKRQDLQRNIDSLSANLKVARAEEERLWKIQKRDESDRQKAKAWSAAFNKIKSIGKRIEDLRVQRQHLTSGEYFFHGLPSPVSAAKTDDDGRFTIVIPRHGRYGIVARTTVEQGEGTETYFWIVWVSVRGQYSKRLTLSNDNMVGAGSPDSALP